MALYHVNPTNGNAGPCKAKKNCPFGGPTAHFDTVEKARQAFELSMGPSAIAAAQKEAERETAAVVSGVQFNNLMAPMGPAPTHFALLEKWVYPRDVEEAFRKFSANPPKGLDFKSLMGSDTRVTNRRVEQYEGLLRHRILNDPDLVKEISRRASAEASARAYGRAYSTGVPIPKAQEEAFERLWTGDFRGKSFFVERGEELQKMREDLRMNRITPAQVVGKGYRDASKVAYEWIDRQLVETGEAINTRGRSDFLNQDFVRRNS